MESRAAPNSKFLSLKELETKCLVGSGLSRCISLSLSLCVSLCHSVSLSLCLCQALTWTRKVPHVGAFILGLPPRTKPCAPDMFVPRAPSSRSASCLQLAIYANCSVQYVQLLCASSCAAALFEWLSSSGLFQNALCGVGASHKCDAVCALLKTLCASLHKCSARSFVQVAPRKLCAQNSLSTMLFVLLCANAWHKLLCAGALHACLQNSLRSNVRLCKSLCTSALRALRKLLCASL